MPPKKKGEKKKKATEHNILTEVDKTFYELQITDLNNKLARLRSLTAELEVKNNELFEANAKIDEDRADVIAYLKRTMQEKVDEINELQDRLKSLQEKRAQETEQFEVKVFENEQEYKNMQEQLTSEIKLLNGKLNALEEFRLQRDDLMKKFQDQEIAFEEQEIRHKREIYSIERKFIIGKDRLKKEMEARLLQLSTEFQDVTDERVAATTHRVIRENIAMNNELNELLTTHKRLQGENDKLKQRDKLLRYKSDIIEEEIKLSQGKVNTQLNIIDQLTREHEIMSNKLETFKNVEKQLYNEKKEVHKLTKLHHTLVFEKHILEQNLHSSRCDRAHIHHDLDMTKEEINYANSIIKEALYRTKAALKTPETQATSHTAVLQALHILFTEAQQYKPRKDSVESIGSCSDIYMKGDLGFMPKKVELRSKFPIKRHVVTQIGGSFEDFVAMQETIISGQESLEEVEEEQSAESGVVEEESKVFFSGSMASEEDYGVDKSETDVVHRIHGEEEELPEAEAEESGEDIAEEEEV